jgi:hypothetical protein
MGFKASSNKLNPLKDKTHLNTTRTQFFPGRKQHTTITNVSILMTFKKTFDLYSENQMKPINTFCGRHAEL